MNSVLRAFLPALALLSLLAFSNPAFADMVQTPKADREAREAREAALLNLQARLSEAGAGSAEVQEGLKNLPTSDVLAMSGSLESARSAGNHYYLVALGICAVAFGIFAICYWGIYRHRMPAPAPEHHCE
ncbi:MAG: hypothetical protein AAB074_16755 [Planctomycetota bacterium]